MAQTHIVRGVATHISTGISRDHKPTTQVWYHSTCVVEWNEDFVRLATGGWWTNTTKTRMNQAANQFNLGFSVTQKDFAWYVTTQAGTFEFYGRDAFRFDRRTGQRIQE